MCISDGVHADGAGECFFGQLRPVVDALDKKAGTRSELVWLVLVWLVLVWLVLVWLVCNQHATVVLRICEYIQDVLDASHATVRNFDFHCF